MSNRDAFRSETSDPRSLSEQQSNDIVMCAKAPQRAGQAEQRAAGALQFFAQEKKAWIKGGVATSHDEASGRQTDAEVAEIDAQEHKDHQDVDGRSSVEKSLALCQKRLKQPASPMHLQSLNQLTGPSVQAGFGPSSPLVLCIIPALGLC
ncbi:predicted protein [Uncinocarpus reesii 1704]|uniref:Uncharacterized protein n=1 Tax=Uncinocarpus reesii (strain UAMH 1704) TaxID=336963 RepID=C4JVX9_UNCRE|nr:uncharacterized protein UREG_06721 [Uncinocarpus reesii 1704]EEP81856.1 predicted protein [Uncinocarpus reesii 1704]